LKGSLIALGTGTPKTRLPPSNLVGTSSEGKAAAKKAVLEIKAAAGTARPILEVSHESWTSYRKREGQPLDQYLVQEKGIEVDESGPLDFLPCVNSDSSCSVM
jgi:hypothetical protein